MVAKFTRFSGATNAVTQNLVQRKFVKEASTNLTNKTTGKHHGFSGVGENEVQKKMIIVVLAINKENCKVTG